MKKSISDNLGKICTWNFRRTFSVGKFESYDDNGVVITLRCSPTIGIVKEAVHESWITNVRRIKENELRRAISYLLNSELVGLKYSEECLPEIIKSTPDRAEFFEKELKLVKIKLEVLGKFNINEVVDELIGRDGRVV